METTDERSSFAGAVRPWLWVGASFLGGMALAAYRHNLRQRELRRFANQVVLVTGGSRGLGFILARELLNSGARVAVCARNGEELERSRRLLPADQVSRFHPYICDVSDPAAVQDLVRIIEAELGPVDLLVNNAGIIQVGPLETMHLDDFKATMGANFWGMVNSTLGVLPSMLRRGSGKIANVTSIGGAVAIPHLLPYTASKFAAVGFSQGLAEEVRGHGIQVTTIIPGLMRTGSFLNALFKGNNTEFTWFSLGATMPVISMDAEIAARRMLYAISEGRTLAVIGLPAKALRLGAAVFPSVTGRALALVNRLFLPKPPGEFTQESRLRPGYVVNAESSASAVTRHLRGLGRRAAQRFNEGAELAGGTDPGAAEPPGK